MIALIVEAALRALLVGIAVWTGLRVFRVTNVLTQKSAWSLVLASALVMPFVMRWQILPDSFAIRLHAPAHHQAAPLTLNIEASRLVRQTERIVTPLRIDKLASAEHTASRLARPAEGRYPAPFISKSTSTMPRDVSIGSVSPITLTRKASLLSMADASARRISAFASRLAKISPLMLATTAYLAVFAFLLARIGYGLYSAARLWLEAEPIVAPFWPAAEDSDTTPLRSSRRIASPVTVGSGIVLPHDWIDWDTEKLRIVLAHERSHVRQGDFYLQVIVALYAAAFWFSPLGWWLKRKLCDLGEAISDHAGLEEAASRAAYAQVLLEFAAHPRPTALGVAMARSGNLSHRIERLLNESRFSQAFAASRRTLLALLLVPAALLGATALIRVEAATSGHQAAAQAKPSAGTAAPAEIATPAPAAAPVVTSDGVATPEPAVVNDSQAEPPAAASEPRTEDEDAAEAAREKADQAREQADEARERADEARQQAAEARDEARQQADEARDEAREEVRERAREKREEARDSNSKRWVERSHGKGYSYSYSSDGESYALITDNSGRVTFSGDWNDDTRHTIDQVRKLTNGKFLWFTKNGKAYFIDDQTQIAQMEAMYKPMEELGKKQEELGRQQEALGHQQEELGEKQQKASIPTPDMSKEIAALNEAVRKLEAKKGSTVTQEELGEINGQLGEIQGRLGEIQGRIGDKQGELGSEQGKLGEQQGKLGDQQGQLGEQQGRLAEQADRHIKSMIDQSLRDGKAHQIQ